MISEYDVRWELNIRSTRGYCMRAPTWFPAGIQTDGETPSSYYRGVAQLVARTAGGREVASSSLVTPTMQNFDTKRYDKEYT